MLVYFEAVESWKNLSGLLLGQVIFKSKNFEMKKLYQSKIER